MVCTQAEIAETMINSFLLCFFFFSLPLPSEKSGTIPYRQGVLAHDTTFPFTPRSNAAALPAAMGLKAISWSLQLTYCEGFRRSRKLTSKKSVFTLKFLLKQYVHILFASHRFLIYYAYILFSSRCFRRQYVYILIPSHPHHHHQCIPNTA